MLIVGSEQFEDYSDQKTVKTILIVYLLAQHEPVIKLTTRHESFLTLTTRHESFLILKTQHEYTYANCI